VPKDKRDPFVTTSRAVGQVIKHTYENDGAKKIVIGSGGSAFVDGGLGAL